MKASSVSKGLCSGNLGISFVLGELKELVEAASWAEFIDELCDVYTGVILVVYETSGVDLHIRWMSTVNKWIEREATWRNIFSKEGLEFSPKYLSDGSNWRKPEKIRAALAKARADQC